MHELSIATNIVEIAEEEAIKAKKSTISEIDIEIGSMSGVIIEALEFAMEEAVKKGVAQNAKINFKELMARANCEKCFHQFEVDDFFAVCPKCGSFETNIISGKDLKIRKIKFD
ncbi:MAG: hydrogenase maturation nickel metallochaperone HypA [Clostridia bacterium]|nr:hydrogenase maturation nickel metallochaperone HypA [Clostridia bacterium]